MTDIRTRLADTDPLQREPALASSEVTAMRQRLLASVPVAPRRWPLSMSLAFVLVLFVAAGVGLTRVVGMPGVRGMSGINVTSDSPSLISTAIAREPSERRQVQFATPGGTRVIWVFNADFESGKR